MKRLFAIILLALTLFACRTHKNEVLIDADNLSTFQPTIVLMHPTVKNIQTFQNLTSNEIFPIPVESKVLGVYHVEGNYNYAQSIDFLVEQGITNIKLIGLSEKLSPDNIYKKNGASPIFKDIFKSSKGIIFFGGPDIPPATYGEPTGLLTEITDVHRHYLEISFLFHLLGGSQDSLFIPLLHDNPDYNILGICLGMQSMNVATGGTMIQDIPTEVYGYKTVEDMLALEDNMRHRNYNTNFGLDEELIWGYFHQINYVKNSFLDSLNNFSDEFPNVWSSHHQAVERLGKGIVPVAWSMDGEIVEVIIHSEFPNVIGLQFHPEVPSIYDQDFGLPIEPFETEKKSFIEKFPGEKGENFHRAFWGFFGEKFK
jgi:putative glutamine amidotransferase